MSRIALAVVVVALAPVLALTGCFNGQAFPVTTKTNEIARQLESLPGVTDVSTYISEYTYPTAAISEVTLGIEGTATREQLTTILQTFATANAETGTEQVSTQLELIADSDPTNRIDIQFDKFDVAQAATVAETWTSLRATYPAVNLSLHYGSGTAYSTDLTITLGGVRSVIGDLTALYDIRSAYSALGPVGYYEQTDGRFSASGGLPDDAWLTFVQQVSEVTEVAGGVYDARDNSFGLLVDAAASDPASLLPIVALVAPGAGVDITFRTPDGTELIFDSRDCIEYDGLAADDPSAVLLTLWASDGRTLVDGSAVASCF